MPEVAVNVPFESNEIKEIVCDELRKRLDLLGPLQGAKEYSSFSIGFNVTIRLSRVGDVTVPKETLAWGTASGGESDLSHEQTVLTDDSEFQSGDPNDERQARAMPLTVEATDGRGGKIRRKVLVKE